MATKNEPVRTVGQHTGSCSRSIVTAEMKKVDLDYILVNEIGQFSWYQIRSVLLAGVIAVFSSWSSEYVFTAARIDTRCLVPECEYANATQFSPQWLPLAVPYSDGAPDACHRYNVTLADGRADSCPAKLFSTDTILPCQQYVYENTNTLVYDLNLACDEWRRSMIGMMRMIGSMLGILAAGYVSDRWGRCFAMVVTSINSAWIGLVRIWAGYYPVYISLILLESLCGCSFNCSHILMMELVGPGYRVYTTAILNTFYSSGLILLGLIAWAVPNWKQLTLALYVPQFLTVTYLWFMFESVRWYMSHNQFEKSEKILKRVAQVNGKHLSEQSLIDLRLTVEEEKKIKQMEEIERKNEPNLFLLVLKYKPILIRCLAAPLWWLTASMVYFGLSINSVNLSGNPYLNFVVVSAIEIPGCWTAVLLLTKMGRKPIVIMSFWICAACMLGFIFTPQEYITVSQVLYLIGKFAASMMMSGMYVYTAELFPTRYRNTLFAYSISVGRLGGIFAPLTPALSVTIWGKLPYAIFAGFAFVSGALVFVTPETIGIKLPDTMEEACNILKKPPLLDEKYT